MIRHPGVMLFVGRSCDNFLSTRSLLYNHVATVLCLLLSSAAKHGISRTFHMITFSACHLLPLYRTQHRTLGLIRGAALSFIIDLLRLNRTASTASRICFFLGLQPWLPISVSELFFLRTLLAWFIRTSEHLPIPSP